MEKLADLSGADKDLRRAIESARKSACSTGDSWTGATWSTGVTAKQSSGNWNYPNGTTAKYNSGAWNYHNGTSALYSSGAWNYPNGTSAKYSSGKWNWPDGNSIKLSELESKSCGLVSAKVCTWYTDALRGASGGEKDFLLVSFAWTAYNTSGGYGVGSGGSGGSGGGYGGSGGGGYSGGSGSSGGSGGYNGSGGSGGSGGGGYGVGSGGSGGSGGGYGGGSAGGEDCDDLRIMYHLAFVGGASSNTLSTIEDYQDSACNRGTLPDRDWPNGKTAKTSGGAWNYPNGKTAKSLGGAWDYPNGKTARSLGKAWDYPNGKTAKGLGGSWNTPEGWSTTSKELFQKSCDRVRREVCDSYEDAIRDARGDLKDLLLIEFAWRAFGN
jgi:hypothetical protein